MTTGPIIRLAQIDDIPAIIALQKTESNRVGFLPSKAIEEHVTDGRALVAVNRAGVRVAYLLGRERLRDQEWVRPITQIVVLNGERRKGIATLMVLRWTTIAQSKGQDIVQAWTRGDLTANMMWHALGFVAVGERMTNTARGIPSTLWRFPMTARGHEKLMIPPERSGWKTAKNGVQLLFPTTPHQRDSGN